MLLTPPAEKESEDPSNSMNGIESSPSTEDDKVLVRYFRCPATAPVSVIKILVRNKYNVPEQLKVRLSFFRLVEKQDF